MYQFEREEQERKNHLEQMRNRATWLRLREKQELSAGHEHSAFTYQLEREALAQAIMIRTSLNLYSVKTTIRPLTLTVKKGGLE